MRSRSRRVPATATRPARQPAALGIAALLLVFAGPTWGQSSPPVRDPYARLIARSDAVTLGRVLEAGTRELPDGAGGVTSQAFVRIAVERWIVGPDTARTLEVRLDPYDVFLEELGSSVSRSDRRAILYITRARRIWWLVREVAARPDRPGVGIEVLSTEAAFARIPSIHREAEATSPDSLAARADLVVVGSLGRHTPNSPGVTCRVERVVAGALADSSLTVVTATRSDLHRGRALLLLVAGSNGTWEVLDDGAGCYYLDLDRVVHSTAPLETVLAGIAAVHARRTGRVGR